MEARKKAIKPSNGATETSLFNAEAFLKSAGVAKTIATYGRGEAVFTQGDLCEHVMYIQTGGIKLSVSSKTGREAVVAMLGPGDFFGEGCLAGQPVRMGSATAITGALVRPFIFLDRHVPAVRRHGYLLATVVTKRATSGR